MNLSFTSHINTLFSSQAELSIYQRKPKTERKRYCACIRQNLIKEIGRKSTYKGGLKVGTHA